MNKDDLEALKALLDKHGLMVIKNCNKRSNLGMVPILVLCRALQAFGLTLIEIPDSDAPLWTRHINERF